MGACILQMYKIRYKHDEIRCVDVFIYEKEDEIILLKFLRRNSYGRFAISMSM